MRVVLVRLSALGDIVHTWPLATQLASAVPGIHLTWIVETPFVPLVDGHPAVDMVISVATRRWRQHPLAPTTRAELDTLRTRLYELSPELCIDPQGVFKSAFITHCSQAPRRVGLARPWRRELIAGFAYTETIPGRSQPHHVVATNLELVRAVGATPPAELPIPDGRWLVTGGPSRGDEDHNIAVILPGAGQPDKILPVSVLAETARQLADDNQPVMVAWGPGEQTRAEEIAQEAGNGVSVAPPTTIEELAQLLAKAGLVIGGDTGPVHLAASLGVPTLAVFLTTDVHRNGPVGHQVAVISAAAEPGRRPSGSARTRQVRHIGAAEIVAAARRLLQCADKTGGWYNHRGTCEGNG